MVAEDPARELAFHYMLFTDFRDVYRDTGGTNPTLPLLVTVNTARNVIDPTLGPVGELTILENPGPTVKSSDTFYVTMLSSGMAVGTVRRIVSLADSNDQSHGCR